MRGQEEHHAARHQAYNEQRRHEIADPSARGGKALYEISSVEPVAPKLPEVRPEERATMMVHHHPRVVNDPLVLAENDRVAEQRVFARPEVCSISAYLPQ